MKNISVLSIIVRISEVGLALYKTPGSKKTTFAFGACYGKPESYEAVFIPIKIELTKSKTDSLSILFKHAKITNDFGQFKILVFVIPMLDPELQVDVHKDYTTYPTYIRIYKRNNNNWQLLVSKKINNYKQYANLQEYYVNEIMMELEK
jgi:hypothetical protein